MGAGRRQTDAPPTRRHHPKKDSRSGQAHGRAGLVPRPRGAGQGLRAGAGHRNGALGEEEETGKPGLQRKPAPHVPEPLTTHKTAVPFLANPFFLSLFCFPPVSPSGGSSPSSVVVNVVV